MAGIFDKLTGIIEELGSKRRGLEAQLEKAKEEREALLTDPPSREQLIGDRIDYLNECQRRFRAVVKLDCDRSATRPFQRFDQVEGFGRKPFGPLRCQHSLVNLPKAPTVASPILILGALAEPLKESVTAAIESLDWPAGGPPIEERRKRIAALDKRIKAIQADLTTLRDKADRAMRL